MGSPKVFYGTPRAVTCSKISSKRLSFISPVTFPASVQVPKPVIPGTSLLFLIFTPPFQLYNVSSLDPKREWPKPILGVYLLRFFPFIKNVWVCGGQPRRGFPSAATRLPYPALLVNIIQRRRLEMHQLDIPSFVPEVWRCFGHFSPIAQSLSLMASRGSSQHVGFFVNLFQNPEDFSLHYNGSDHGPGYTPGGETLIPPFIPPLRGWLAVWNMNVKPFIEDMNNLSGRIRFTRLVIFGLTKVSYLLRTCARTLRILRSYPNDPRGERRAI